MWNLFNMLRALCLKKWIYFSYKLNVLYSPNKDQQIWGWKLCTCFIHQLSSFSSFMLIFFSSLYFFFFSSTSSLSLSFYTSVPLFQFLSCWLKRKTKYNMNWATWKDTWYNWALNAVVKQMLPIFYSLPMNLLHQSTIKRLYSILVFWSTSLNISSSFQKTLLNSTRFYTVAVADAHIIFR